MCYVQISCLVIWELPAHVNALWENKGYIYTNVPLFFTAVQYIFKKYTDFCFALILFYCFFQ